MPDPKIITPNAPSVVDQAQDVRVKAKAAKINNLANEITDILKNKVWEANVVVGEYTVLMQAVTDKMRSWYNDQINAKNTQDVILKPEPPKETILAKEPPKPEGKIQ